MTDEAEVVDENDAYVVVPMERLQPDILEALIQEFILTEGANHGAEDTPMATKIAQVKQQLTKGSAAIVYHLVQESCRIVPANKGAPRL